MQAYLEACQPGRSMTWSKRSVTTPGSAREVSRICQGPDVEIDAFAEHSLAGQALPYVFVDASYSAHVSLD